MFSNYLLKKIPFIYHYLTMEYFWYHRISNQPNVKGYMVIWGFNFVRNSSTSCEESISIMGSVFAWDLYTDSYLRFKFPMKMGSLTCELIDEAVSRDRL